MGQVSAYNEKLCGADQQWQQIRHTQGDKWMALIGWCGKPKNHQYKAESAELCRVEVVAQKANKPRHN